MTPDKKTKAENHINPSKIKPEPKREGRWVVINSSTRIFSTKTHLSDEEIRANFLSRQKGIQYAEIVTDEQGIQRKAA